jgi:hypothetical protein
MAYLFLRIRRSGLFNFENEPIWLIHDSNSFFVFLIVLVEPCRLFKILCLVDTSVRLVVLVYCEARATPNDRLRQNAATTVDYRVGL